MHPLELSKIIVAHFECFARFRMLGEGRARQEEKGGGLRDSARMETTRRAWGRSGFLGACQASGEVIPLGFEV